MQKQNICSSRVMTCDESAGGQRRGGEEREKESAVAEYKRAQPLSSLRRLSTLLGRVRATLGGASLQSQDDVLAAQFFLVRLPKCSTLDSSDPRRRPGIIQVASAGSPVFFWQTLVFSVVV